MVFIMVVPENENTEVPPEAESHELPTHRWDIAL